MVDTNIEDLLNEIDALKRENEDLKREAKGYEMDRDQYSQALEEIKSIANKYV